MVFGFHTLRCWRGQFAAPPATEGLSVAVAAAVMCAAAAAVVEAQNELTQKVLSQCETREQFKWVPAVQGVRRRRTMCLGV